MEGVQMDRNIRTRTVVFFLLAAALSISTAAQAETIFLKCGSFDLLSVNLTNHTVNNRPASITPAAIDWHIKKQISSNESGDTHWHIDRVAGTFTLSNVVFRPNGNNLNLPTTTGTCTAVSKPATKF
jgi:hypothetical protein